MFTQKCFIRKNTPELVDKLSLLGGRSGAVFFDEKYNTLAVEEIFFRCVADNTADTLIKQGFIDCGTNEELFLAIAALRDDSDKFQYFTNGVFWIKCSQLELKHELDNNYEEFCVADFHKATVEELIEHFKK
jgi:hypothetical protein